MKAINITQPKKVKNSCCELSQWCKSQKNLNGDLGEIVWGILEKNNQLCQKCQNI